MLAFIFFCFFFRHMPITHACPHERKPNNSHGIWVELWSVAWPCSSLYSCHLLCWSCELLWSQDLKVWQDSDSSIGLYFFFFWLWWSINLSYCALLSVDRWRLAVLCGKFRGSGMMTFNHCADLCILLEGFWYEG